MIYVLIDIASNTVREYRDFGAETPPDVIRKGIKWLPLEVTDPPFDSATQVKEGPVTSVLADRVTRVWTVRAKTALELDADKEAQLDAIDRLQLEVDFNHENRIRTLEARPAITRAQFRAAMKGMLT